VAEQRIEESRAFFGPRAATWDSRFPDDGPAYARAVDDLAPGQGARVLDLGCGTGRAVEALRRVVGARGSVAGVDVTPEMVDTARRAGRDRQGVFVVGDGGRLPFAPGCFDAVFAAGVITHLPPPEHGLTEITRVTRHGGRLAIFHPIGRAALAARRGHGLSPDDLLDERNVGPFLAGFGWTLTSLEDGEDRYLALATRR
jgi:SAM-dependent methyltransferase